MRPVTVRWHHEAENELAQLWLTASDKRSIRAAGNDIDARLAVSPSLKGQPFALATLDELSTALIQQRASVLPEDLRTLRSGPVEVFFWPLEDDGMAIVLHARLR